MQVFKLVDPGRVDRVIAFDSLPEKMVSKVRRIGASGFPKSWLEFLGVKRGDNSQPFYFLDFRTINSDKEKWQEIQNYARRATDKSVRLMDNLYDMAKPVAPDSYSSLELEVEDVPIIPILSDEEQIAEEIEDKPALEVKRRGRPPKKEEVNA